MIIKKILRLLPYSAEVILLTLSTQVLSIGSSEEKCDILSTEMDSHIVLREEPDTSKPITAKIALADAQTIEKTRISNDEKWLNIKLNGHSGWISTQYIRCRYSPQVAKKIIIEVALKTINAIKDSNWKELAALTHPEKGVRFSTKSHIDIKKDQVVKADNLHKAFYSPLKRIWGINRNSKEEIALTFADFTAEFLHQFKFWKSTNIKYNELTDSIKHPNNVEKIYPHAIIAEFKVTDLDPKVHGISASTLCLVFEEADFEWRLVGIVRAL